jgi:hypothetical protein
MGSNPIQKIIFGPPGVGKSYYVHNEIAKELEINDEKNKFSTVFHPEYRYGDFVGKLLPYTDENGQIKYIFYRGVFLKALAKAYKNILDLDNLKKTDETKNIDKVLLIIDEINRGNCAAIFGDIFQLLDRDENGWSSYKINISDLEFEELLKEIGIKEIEEKGKIFFSFSDSNIINENLTNKIKSELSFFLEKKIKLPPNLSIVATMNTSNDSIYYMDPAFKRRWDWEYMNINGVHPIYEDLLKNKIKEKLEECDDIDDKLKYELKNMIENFILINCKSEDNKNKDNKDKLNKLKEEIEEKFDLSEDCKSIVENIKEEMKEGYENIINQEIRIERWVNLRNDINKFMRNNANYIRGLEDKLIGKCFLKGPITCEKIINKLLFYLWDTVFEGNRELAEELLKEICNKDSEGDQNKYEIITFEDFILKFKKCFCIEKNLIKNSNQ